MFFVDAAHEGGSRWNDLLHINEDRLLGRKLYALPNNIDKLANGEIGWNKVLLLVDRGDIRFLDLLADNLQRAR